MKKDIDVVALGELLIDFTANGLSEQNNLLFEANPGGAPCNVLAMLSRMNKKTAFIGKVGKDGFGKILEKALVEMGIETDGLVEDLSIPTTLAFVHTLPDGDREFSFYRNPGADMMLEETEVKSELIERAKIFHFGSLSMTHERNREATRQAIQIAKESQCIISFDPNLRPLLWNTHEEAEKQIRYGMECCDVMKISDDEIIFISGMDTVEKGIQYVRENFGIKLLLVTLGDKGSIACYKNYQVYSPGVRQERVIDTTGAGDTFCGAVLNYILEHGMEDLTEHNLKEMLLFANIAASIIVTKRGALRSMPQKAEIERVMNTVNDKDKADNR